MEANALEAFHAANVELMFRTGKALGHVEALPNTSDVRKAVLKSEIELDYANELDLLRSYYGVYD